MAHSYTPGLRVTPDAVIRKRRILPIPGEVLVAEGEQVTATTVVAQTALPGKVYPVNVANKLSVTPSEIPTYLRKREGETVTKDEVFAENSPLIKWFKTQVRAPINGKIESVSRVTGQVFLREPPQIIRLLAYIDGTIVEVTPTQGAVVESRCAFVQGIFGVGGETAGTITVVVRSPDEILTADHLASDYQGHIVIGGALAQKETFARARELGISALVVGGVHDRDLRDLLGYDLGVAITGTEKIGFTLIITEGFGTIPMAKRTFDLLSAKVGQKASCIAAGRPGAGPAALYRRGGPGDAAAEGGGARAEYGTHAGHGDRWAPPAGRHRGLSPHPVRGAARARVYERRPVSARALVDGVPGAPHGPHPPGSHALWRRTTGVSRTPPGVARNQNGDGHARAQFYADQTRGCAPCPGAFCLYHEADPSQAPAAPARVRGQRRIPPRPLARGAWSVVPGAPPAGRRHGAGGVRPRVPRHAARAHRRSCALRIVTAWPSATAPMARRVADGRCSAAARDTSNA